jgi:hypothetical protein
MEADVNLEASRFPADRGVWIPLRLRRDSSPGGQRERGVDVPAGVGAYLVTRRVPSGGRVVLARLPTKLRVTLAVGWRAPHSATKTPRYRVR